MQMPMPGLQTGQMAQGMVGQTLPPNPSAMMEAQAQKMAQAQALYKSAPKDAWGATGGMPVIAGTRRASMKAISMKATPGTAKNCQK